MAFSFDITVKDVPSALKKAKNEGAPIFGDESGGKFDGSGVKGNYTVSGNNVHITIDSKPLIATENMIKKKIKEYFE